MKRFYNNTLIGGAFSKALRVVALLCVLLGFSSSAWGETYYLRYGIQDNYDDVSYVWSSGVVANNNICTFTNISLKSGNNYIYLAKDKEDRNSLLSTDYNFSYTNNESSISHVESRNWGGKRMLLVQVSNAISVNIKVDLSNSKNIVFTFGAGGCTPSATITGATYSNGSINLSGRLSQVCDSKPTFYGWQYKTSASGDWEAYISGTGGKDNSSQTTKDYSYAWNNEGNLVAGTTYYFRAYATYDAQTWYSDNKILSVTIPKGGGSTGEADCDNIIYLNPGVWEHTDGQRYAAYFFNGTSSDMWVDMKATTSGGECAGLYYVKMPEGGYKNVLFGRMNPGMPYNNFTHKDQGGPMYNQTENCTLVDGKNLYAITGWTDGDDSKSGVADPTKSNCTDGCTPAEQPSTNVLLSREAIVNKTAKTAQLFGYLKATDCNRYTDYGFYYCMVDDGDTPCLPTTTSSTKLQANPSPQLERGMEFTATVGIISDGSDAIQDGKTYYYRAYAKYVKDDGKEEYILSGEIRSFSTDPCIPQYGGLSSKYVDGTPIVYTINGSESFAENTCKLHFKSLQDAIDHLRLTWNKDDDFKYVTKSGNSYNLNQPVIMKVQYYQTETDGELSDGYYRGTDKVGNYAGSVAPLNSNLLEGFNMDALDEKNTLTIKAGDKVAKPLIHHIVIRNSKNIVLDSLCIYSDPNETTLDNALEIDVNSTQWQDLTTGQFESGNITIQNCLIHSSGFTGIHVSGYDGLTFKNNEFEARFKGSSDDNTKKNMLNWGASVKFLACKNIKFIQNNFMGSHPTSLWVQECQSVLFMNNVFWNTNEFVPANGSKTAVPTAVRLVSQYGNGIDNVGFYYNTFYFANNTVDASWAKYNFFNRCAVHRKGDLSLFGSNIYFKYNNCYSYDLDCPGKYDVEGKLEGNDASATYTTINPTSTSGNLCPNNFWSKYDQNIYESLSEDKKNTYVSAFAFGCSTNEFINVSTQVCSTSALKPSSLIVKGKLMNNGININTAVEDESTYIELTNITLTDQEKYSDRYEMGIRPNDADGKWTYGAYQSRDDEPTSVIYWVGNTSDWDDRNNWEYEKEEAGVTKRLPVSCANSFSEDLKVIIEEVGTYQIEGGRKWPQVPASFTENRTNSEFGEHVSAGLGTINNPTKFASTIELEYGAGLKGVENLREADGTLRYDRAITHFDADRNKWLLVGPVVRPFKNGNSGETRDVVSGDYFRNYEPQIYMHKTEVAGDKISWNKTFGDLNVPVYPNTVFAINASIYYGKYYDTAEDYLKYEGIKVDDKAPIPYMFTGRFAVEEGQRNTAGNYVYSLTSGTNLLNNVYPCNIDVTELEKLGDVVLYDYEKGRFECTTAKNARALAVVRAQNGFVFTPNNGATSLEISQALLLEGSTRTRSAKEVLPTFSLDIDNANTTDPGASNIVISYDELLGSEESSLNTPKVFTSNSNTPEAYIINKDTKYTRLISGKEKVSIPLGVRLQKPMNITFEKVYNEGYDEVILVDTKTQKFYNLLKRNYTTEVLAKGEIEDRFYLNLTLSGDDDIVEEGDNNTEGGGEEGGDVTTNVEETTEEADINIYSVDNSIVRVIASGTTLNTIYVSDMTGRTDKYEVDGNFAELQLPVSSGVYTVYVIGDTASKIGKVILK